MCCSERLHSPSCMQIDTKWGTPEKAHLQGSFALSSRNIINEPLQQRDNILQDICVPKTYRWVKAAVIGWKCGIICIQYVETTLQRCLPALHTYKVSIDMFWLKLLVCRLAHLYIGHHRVRLYETLKGTITFRSQQFHSFLEYRIKITIYFMYLGFVSSLSSGIKVPFWQHWNY